MLDAPIVHGLKVRPIFALKIKLPTILVVFSGVLVY
jgi:hypothetical protein